MSTAHRRSSLHDALSAGRTITALMNPVANGILIWSLSTRLGASSSPRRSAISHNGRCQSGCSSMRPRRTMRWTLQAPSASWPINAIATMDHNARAITPIPIEGRGTGDAEADDVEADDVEADAAGADAAVEG